MDEPRWLEKLLNAGEGKVTEVVNRVLATPSPDLGVLDPASLLEAFRQGRLAWIQEGIQELDLPARAEMDALEEKVMALNERLTDVATRLEALEARLAELAAAPSRKRATPKGSKKPSGTRTKKPSGTRTKKA